jgi:hypothetical protein
MGCKLVSRRTLLGLILLLLIIGLGTGFIIFKQSAPPKELSSEHILQAIIHDIPAFSSAGKPIIQIASVSHIEGGWYVVILKSLHPVKTFVPVKVILMDQGLPDHLLTVVLGPDTHFTEDEMTAHNLPDPVILELQKS